MTAILSPFTAADAYWAMAIDTDNDEAETGAGVSYERCIDWLAELQQSTDDAQLRALVADTLYDLERLGRFGADMRDVVLGALASIEVAFEISAAR